MKIIELCDRSTPTVFPQEVITQFETQLLHNNYLIVCEKDNFLGLLIRDDIRQDPYCTALDCVTHKPILRAGQTLEEALQVMKEGAHPFLPVFENDHFAGVLSYKSLVQAIFREHQELKQELFKLEKYEIMDNVTAGFVHDFNNILQVIQGNLAILKMSGNLNNLDDAVEAAEIGIVKARNLMKRLSRHDRQLDIQKEPVDLRSFIPETAKFFLRSARNVTFHMDIDPDLPTVELDTVRFSQVLSNLIVNACQAMPQGGTLTIQARNFTISEDTPLVQLLPGDYIHLTVEDTGPGIPPDIIVQLFTPYFTTKPTGNGLGLAVSREIVEGHQGIITATSEPECGACFNIFLPVRPA